MSYDANAGAWQQATAARRRRRFRYLAFSLPVAIVLVVVASLLVGRLVDNQIALSKFAAGDYTGSAKQSTGLLDNNIIEPYIPWFNRGNAYAAKQEFTDAIDDFEKALVAAPADKSCTVRVNLALAWEKLGDGYAAGGYYEGAILLYKNAAAVLAGDPGCKPPDAAGEQLQTAKQRVQDKIDQAQKDKAAAEAQAGTDPGAGGQDDQLKQLGQEGQNGAQEKANGDAAQRGEGDPKSGQTDKPW